MRKENALPKWLILISLAVVTYSLFTFEIMVTRLFSAIMLYHFVFVAVSLAILSIGLGGIYVFKRVRNTKGRNKDHLYQSLMKNSSLLMAVSIPVNTLVVYKIPYNQLLFFPYLILAAVPFIAAGIFISSAFKQFSGWSHVLYFSDLLGSAMGGVIVVQLINYYSMLRVSLMLSLLPLLVYIFFNWFGSSRKKTRTAAASAAWMLLVAVVMAGGPYIDNWTGNFKAYNGGAKVLGKLDNPQILFTTWNAFARTDVVKTNDPDKMFVMLDGSAGSYMVRFDGDWNKVDYLKKEAGYIPFITRKSEAVLLIGPGGGLDILLAKMAGAKNIDAVEINPGTVKATEYFSEYSGNPYRLPGVNTYIRDGRTFAQLTQKNYDVIYLSKVMTQASEAMGYALSENYVYTLEAFNTYLNRLNRDGRIAMVLHDERDLQKAMATAVKALTDRGLTADEAFNRMAVVAGNQDGNSHSHGVMYPLLLIKNDPFTAEESRVLMQAINQSGQSALLVPGIIDKTGMLPANNGAALAKVKPATDDSPFFYNNGGGTVSFLLVTLLVVLLVGKKYFGFIMGRKAKVSTYTHYFMLLGVGFMLIEVPLVQKFVLYFGHPTTAFTVVIATLLLFGGMGSIIGKRLPANTGIRYAALVIAGYSAILAFALPWIFSAWSGNLLFDKIAVTLLVLGPLGLMMGVPFPSGLMLLAKKFPEDFIPLMWGVNGWMSVAGSILAMIVAMLLGFKWSLALGAVAYIGAIKMFKPETKVVSRSSHRLAS